MAASPLGPASPAGAAADGATTSSGMVSEYPTPAAGENGDNDGFGVYVCADGIDDDPRARKTRAIDVYRAHARSTAPDLGASPAFAQQIRKSVSLRSRMSPSG